jgi:uncharacterized membrane-anchored protein
MKKTVNVLGLFCCLAVLQVAVPIFLFVRHQSVLRTGRQFRFAARPVDPYDAFRGRYVALGFEQDRTVVPGNTNLKRGQKVYISIKEDGRGFAEIAGISHGRPAEGDYVQARVSHARGEEVHIRFPFTRYYTEEKLASGAESAYQKHSGAGAGDTYVTVRIKSGYAAIEELHIAGRPVLEFLQENP